MMTQNWCDAIDEEVLPEIPWLSKQVNEITRVETAPVKPWGVLKKDLIDFNINIDPLDRAGEFYLTALWNASVVSCIIKSNKEKELKVLNQELMPLDNATEIYLNCLWKQQVEEATKNEWTVVSYSKNKKIVKH